ncbi:hypothetical protein [Streptomyces subrutilus]|uniref:hypothetical protein n=1 Tax=Streptomyces subrutilus TaxID=36818 RepID=UPI0033D72622
MYDLMTLAAVPSGNALKNAVLLLVGNVFAAWLAVRAVRNFIKDDWGAMITMAVGAVFVAGFVWFPDQAKVLLQGLWDTVRAA